MQSMIVAPQAQAVEIGAAVLASGGNAIDAAVTTAFAQGVLDPQMCGVGGFGSATVRLADGALHTVAFHGRAGVRATPTMWQELVLGEYRDGYGFHLQDYLNDVGYQSITTPGTIAGLAQLLEQFGTRSWAACIAPAVPLAREGYRLTPKGASRFHRPKVANHPHTMMRASHTPGAQAIFTRDGHYPWHEGERFVQADYATTLERLAANGPAEFYTGATAQAMAADFARHGGFTTAEDLANYSARQLAPLVGTYRGYTVVTDPPPSGGLTLLAMLNVVEGYDLRSLGHNSAAYIDLLARTMQWAYRDWATVLGDPEFSAVPVERLASKEYAAAARAALDGGARFEVPRWRADEQGTTHISVLDQWGNAVSLTHSLGASSGVVTSGLGFQYNNCMNCFDPLPGHANSIAPGKARLSGLAPTILLKDGAPAVVIGAPGGTRITTGVFQSILNIVDFGMRATEAVSAPRFDAQGSIIDIEARIAETVCAELRAMGHPVERLPIPWWRGPLVHAIVRDPQTGQLDGGADPRGEGMALLV